MKIFSLLLVVFQCTTVLSQYNELRYRTQLFNTVNTQTDIQYGSAPQWIWPYWNTDLLLDVYQPAGDVINNRPLVILAHSGGFLNGAKDVSDMTALCDSLAKLGYVTASIEYRKGFDPLDDESAERAVYRAIQDGKAAVRFFKENAAVYGIDTNFIYFGGMSAGGYISLHVAYMDLESERPASTYGGGTVNDLGCLDCAGNTYGHSSKVRAILDYWGAVQDTTIISTGDVPLMIMHGVNDGTVPYNYGYPFGLWTLPETYGGGLISQRAQHLGLDYELYTSQGSLHMLDGSDNGTFNSAYPANSFWYDTLLPRTRAFLYRMTKPYPAIVELASTVFCAGESITFEVTGGANSYYKWYYDAAHATGITDNHTSSLTLSFTSPGDYSVGVVEFNEVYCASDTLWFAVHQAADVVADFDYVISAPADVAFTDLSTTAQTIEWDFGDGNTSNLQNPEHTYAANGNYTVTLTIIDTNGCSDSLSRQVIIESLGLDENSFLSVDVYPNPADDHLVLRNGSGARMKVVWTDINGRALATPFFLETDETLSFSVADWTAGTYLLLMTDETGRQCIKRIVIE